MTAQVLYHGTPGDNILEILRTRMLVPSGGEIYFATRNVQSVLQYGADLKRKRTFAIKVEARLPEGARLEQVTRAGAPWDAVVLATRIPVFVEVLELYVRQPRRTQVEIVTGAERIRELLEGVPT